MDPVFKLAQSKLTKKNIESVTTVGVKTLFFGVVEAKHLHFSKFSNCKTSARSLSFGFSKAESEDVLNHFRQLQMVYVMSLIMVVA